MPKPRFFKWREYLLNSDLSLQAKTVGTYIRDQYDDIHATYYLTTAVIADDLMVSIYEVRLALEELEDEGWLIIDGEVHDKPSYLLVVPECVE